MALPLLEDALYPVGVDPLRDAEEPDWELRTVVEATLVAELPLLVEVPLADRVAEVRAAALTVPPDLLPVALLSSAAETPCLSPP